MRFIVLGHTGFVGKNLMKYLINEGHSAAAISRKECDFRDFKSLKRALQSCGSVDAIFNCAANVGSVHYVTKYAADVISDNVLMSLNLYNCVKEMANPPIVLNPFSNCCYANGTDIQKEENWLKGEVHPSVFSFGNFKRTLYYISKCYKTQHDIKSINLMFSGIYGPGDSTDPNKVHALNGMIIRMLGSIDDKDGSFEIWGTGKPIREWIYIDDVCKIMLQSLSCDSEMIEPLNIAQGKGFSIAETAGCISKSTGFGGKLTFNTKYQDGAPIKILSDDRFKKVFPNYEYHNHQAGIDKTVEYYKGVLQL